MKWYPWLDIPYRQILSYYQRGRKHPALLLHSQTGNGEVSLCYALSQWLICQQPNNRKSCGICYNCRLMMAGNHPDFYQPNPEKGRQTLGMDSIHGIIDSVYDHARHGGRKVVLLLNTEQLTKQAINALLKILEEPPEKVYFLLVCKTLAHLLPTLRSRCLYWALPTPSEEFSSSWLGKLGFNDSLSACAALRLCANAPLAAKALLQPIRWKKRLALCETLQNVLINGDFLTLLPVMNQDQDNEPLYWLLSLLVDALKWQQGVKEYLINIDKKYLIVTLAKRLSTDILHTQWKQCLLCLRQCHEISGVNRELLLTYYLLNWEHSVSHIYVSK